jgi:hypothetical protein
LLISKNFISKVILRIVTVSTRTSAIMPRVMAQRLLLTHITFC